jgi:hypothetical protein
MQSKLTLFVLAAAASAGCQEMNTPLYFAGNMQLMATGGTMNGMQERIKDSLALRFRNPSDQERMDLQKARDAADPVKVPWISRDHVHIELTYTVQNTSTMPGVFNVSVDGATEFIKYDEDVVAAAIAAGQDNQDATYLPLMQSRPQMLDGGKTYASLFREDDFAEAELDLDAMDQFMGNFAALVTNRSDVDPTGLEMVPKNTVVPAMIEADVTFTASVPMTLTYMVRVRDDDDQLLHQDGDTLFNPTPAVFQPVIPAQP